MFAFRQMSQKNTHPKNKFVNVLIYHKAANYMFNIFSLCCFLIKSFEDFCLEGIEICNANLQ